MLVRTPSALILLTMMLPAALLSAGCSDTASDEARTIKELEARAQSRPRQVELSLGYLHHHGPDWPVDNVRIGGPQGQEAELSRLLVVTSAVEFHLCAPTNTLGAWLYEQAIPTAAAHVPSSANRLGTPYVEDLLGPARATRMVGGVAPPVGDYCEMHVLLTPADDDIINLTDVPTSELEGHTALIEGRWRPTSDSDWQGFRWTYARHRIASTPLFNPKDGSAPLALTSPEQTALLLVDKTLTTDDLQAATWSADGPDFAPVLDRIIHAIRLYRFDRPSSP
ncbi:hypothetical protein DL240_01995 [Lujinxingia litoralis]|uniref:Uncharacterized protein n=1 Tax=Lujinxingia litoralis TaxID=2211119 RepID=A0A328C8R6_9DELT|nr:hypothetical protein [Lujinxingia litoralis]RAL25007.1 hypothetical protein DL240_01995 [Lujinxingia litoralis]